MRGMRPATDGAVDSHMWRLRIPTMHYTGAVIGRAGKLGRDKKGDYTAQAVPTENRRVAIGRASDKSMPDDPSLSLCIIVDHSLIKRCGERGNQTFISDSFGVLSGGLH